MPHKLDIFETRFHNPSMNAVRAQLAPTRRIVDFCVPANSYFPPPQLLADMRAELPELLKYYPDYAPVHQQHIGELIGIPAENIVAANGVTELITLMCRNSVGAMLTDTPTFGRWTDLPLAYGTPVHFLQREADQRFVLSVEQIVQRVRETGVKTLVLCNPSNPTGACLSAQGVRELADRLSDLDQLIIDESFVDFSDIQSAESWAIDTPHVVVVKSMGKSLGWHGMRLGYSVSHQDHAAALRSMVPYWNINGIAAFVLKNVSRYAAQYRESFKKVARDRDYMLQRLQTVPGLTTYPSGANFLFSKLPNGVSGKVVRDILLQDHGLLVRECSNKVGSSENYLRCVVRVPADVDLLVDALSSVLALVPSVNTVAA